MHSQGRGRGRGERAQATGAIAQHRRAVLAHLPAGPPARCPRRFKPIVFAGSRRGRVSPCPAAAGTREGTAPKDEGKVTSASNTICLGRLLALTSLLGAPEPTRRLQLVGSASSPCSCAFVSAPDLAMGKSAAAAAMIAPPCPSIRSGGVSGPLFRPRRPLGEPPWLPLRDARPFPVLRVSRRSIPGWRRQDAGPAARQRC